MATIIPDDQKVCINLYLSGKAFLISHINTILVSEVFISCYCIIYWSLISHRPTVVIFFAGAAVVDLLFFQRLLIPAILVAIPSLLSVYLQVKYILGFFFTYTNWLDDYFYWSRRRIQLPSFVWCDFWARLEQVFLRRNLHGTWLLMNE